MITLETRLAWIAGWLLVVLVAFGTAAIVHKKETQSHHRDVYRMLDMVMTLKHRELKRLIGISDNRLDTHNWITADRPPALGDTGEVYLVKRMSEQACVLHSRSRFATYENSRRKIIPCTDLMLTVFRDSRAVGEWTDYRGKQVYAVGQILRTRSVPPGNAQVLAIIAKMDVQESDVESNRFLQAVFLAKLTFVSLLTILTAWIWQLYVINIRTAEFDRVAVSNSIVPMVVTNSSGLITRANDAAERLFEGEIVGLSTVHLAFGKHREKHAICLRRLNAGGKVHTFGEADTPLYDAVTLNGRVFPVALTISRVDDEHFLAVIMDMSKMVGQQREYEKLMQLFIDTQKQLHDIRSASNV